MSLSSQDKTKQNIKNKEKQDQKVFMKYFSIWNFITEQEPIPLSWWIFYDYYISFDGLTEF